MNIRDMVRQHEAKWSGLVRNLGQWDIPESVVNVACVLESIGAEPPYSFVVMDDGVHTFEWKNHGVNYTVSIAPDGTVEWDRIELEQVEDE